MLNLEVYQSMLNIENLRIDPELVASRLQGFIRKSVLLQRNGIILGLSGFFIRYVCDHAADILPLKGLYKTQVRQLAHYLTVPSRIINRVPSPDVIPGMKVEDILGDYQTIISVRESRSKN